MKIRELIESPYLVPQVHTPNRKAQFAYSDNTLKREFIKLYSEIINGKNYTYSIKKNLSKSIVTTPAINKNGELLNKILIDLDLRQLSEPIQLENPLQVVSVSADESISGLGLTSSLYIILAKKNYSLVSDLVQFLGGQGLWKKISRNSKSVGLRVRLWNLETNKWLTNSNGDVILYDTLNMTDDDIWKDFSLIVTEVSNRKTCLLVLSK